MSTDKEQEPLENGAEIIKRFGGIRPMAGKIDIPVTTVQGWKKRDTIPAARRDLVIEAAHEHGINLVDLVPDFGQKLESDAQEGSEYSGQDETASPTIESDSQNEPSHEESAYRNQDDEDMQEPGPANTATQDHASQSGAQKPKPSHNNSFHPSRQQEYVTMEQMNEKMKQIQQNSIRRSLWGAAVMIVVIAGAAAFLLWPVAQKTQDTIETNSKRLVSLEKGVSDLDQKLDETQGKRGSFFGGIIPEKVNKRLEELGQSTQEIRDRVSDLSNQASEMAKDISSGDSAAIKKRLLELESRFSEFTGVSSLNNVLATLGEYQSGPGGQARLQDAMKRLSALVENTQKNENSRQADDKSAKDIEKALEGEKGKETELGQVLEGVENNNLKAAAMLLAFTQVRSSLNRDNTSFKSDLEILRSLVPEENKDLRKTLDQLAPKAEEGILTPSGLSDQLRSMSGEIVSASLKGEDVSISEKAKAKMNEMISIEKNGELVTGNETQKKINKAQDLLEKGDVEQAVKVLEELNPESKKAAQPVLQQAYARLDAQALQEMLKETIASNLAGGTPMTSSMKGRIMLQRIKKEIDTATSPGVFTDPESGYSILPRN